LEDWANTGEAIKRATLIKAKENLNFIKNSFFGLVDQHMRELNTWLSNACATLATISIVRERTQRQRRRFLLLARDLRIWERGIVK
jgi:hypothetical protein